VSPEQPLLNIEGVSKAFPGVRAVSNVDFAVAAGEVVSLVGLNGAGKSTLMSIIGGICKPDEGTVSIGGNEVRIASPAVAEQLGIGFVHQEPTMVPNMSVADNIFLHRERTRKGFLDFKAMHAESARIMSTLGFDIDPRRVVSSLSVVEREAVEIANAMLLNPRLLILDEVTAPLDSDSVERLFELIAALKAQGMAIIFISHRLDEVIRISDRIVVLRDGTKVGDLAADDSGTEREIIALMVGQPPSAPADDVMAAPVHAGEQLLAVRELSRRPHYDSISFEVARGEILGFAGLKGSGITEMLKGIFGALRIHSGEITVAGRQVTIRRPDDAIRSGIGMLTNDRHHEGLALARNLTDNITVSTLERFARRLGFVRRGELRSHATSLAQTLTIKTPSVDQYVLNLSGGNQQKVVLAKWVLRNLDVLIADEPTRGVDVRAKDEIYKLLVGLTTEGTSIMLHSPEVTELLAVCDRIIVIDDGHIVGAVRAHTPEFALHHVLEMMHSDMAGRSAAAS